jgi:Uma2 family endonuclease
MASTTRERRPTWELADMMFPRQGDWSVEKYLELETNRLIEFTDGFLEVLPMPEEIHSFVQRFIFAAVEAFLAARGKGVTHVAPFKIRVRPGAFREPDVCVLMDEADPRRGRKYWGGADFVVEVVSPGGETRDYYDKRSEYADAKIPEYWIVDPFKQELLVLRLADNEYVVHGVLHAGHIADSIALPGFTLDVGQCFAAAKRAAPNDEPSVGREH